LFYEEQGQLWSADTDLFVEFAGRAGVSNLDQFRQCLDSGKYADKAIELDRARRADSIRLRPTFDIGGQLLPGAQSYSELSQRIDAALAQQ
ncbi:MAG: thioredoxin domain-containing protein, partial [Anaerolineae bacterium]|nr:thioredoxin domain-containing protein [Anaerolineae bacterium]